MPIKPNTFPIDAIKSEFLAAMTTDELVVLSAPPGAGKSTVLPLWLLENSQVSISQENGWQKIYLLQPRRMAAKSIACYLAQQLGEKVGQSVGYRLRNETKVSANTKLEVITEGILTQIIQNDPELTGCNLIIFDEFHERSVNADLAFALSREVQMGLRDDLSLLLMSATLDTDTLKQQLPEAKFLASEGRSFPIEIEYLPAKPQQFWREHALSVLKQQLNHQGSILVFLPGTADIRYLAEQLETLMPADKVLAPLYGELSLQQQQQAIAKPATGSKLVLATNIAETSLTIEGIDLVIDAGLEKVAMFDISTLTNKLITQQISKASAIQRAGRAGRVMAGRCIRLYGKETFERRPQVAPVEILQADLQPILIEAARWGVTSLSDLPLLTLPEKRQETEGWQALNTLAIVDSNNKLTSHGEKVAKLATHPRFAHMLLSAQSIEADFNVVGLTKLACLLAALLEERDIFSKQQAQDNADIALRVHALVKEKSNRQQRIMSQAKQLARQLKIELNNISELPVQFCGHLLALAYPERIAKKRNNQGAYLAVNGKGLQLSPQDALVDADYICAANVIKLNNTLVVSLGAEVDLTTLKTWQVVKLKQQKVAELNQQQGQIIAQQQARLGAIVISSKADNSQLTNTDISNMWQYWLQQHGIQALAFNSKTQNLLARWRWLTQFQPHLNLPEASENALLANLELWFTPYIGDIRTVAALKKIDFGDKLLALIDYAQQQLLEQFAPAKYTSPTGHSYVIEYSEKASPMVSLPMQAMYGEQVSPVVGDVQAGKGINITLSLLSPAKRPLQVTQDLAQFWQGSYKEVQKEMKGRYPKHFWPDSPANENPTSKTKKQM